MEHIRLISDFSGLIKMLWFFFVFVFIVFMLLASILAGLNWNNLSEIIMLQHRYGAQEADKIMLLEKPH